MSDDTPRYNSSHFDLHRSPLHQLRHLNQKLSDIFESEIGGSVLTARQFAILYVVSCKEGLSQSALVQKTGIDRSTLAEIIKRMIKKGYISRRRMKEDGRAYSVKITENGMHALKLAEPIVKRIDEKILSILPQGQGARFLSDLNVVLKTLDTRRKKEAEV